MSVLTADRNLAKLNPEFRRRVEKFLKECMDQEIPIKVSEAWRSNARQKWLWSLGRFFPNKQKAKKTWVTYSLHQEGKAIDIFFNNGGDIYVGDWDKVYDIAERCGLESLYRLQGVDRPHLQMDEHWRPAFDRKKHENVFIKWGIVEIPKNLDKPPTREEMYKIDYLLFERLFLKINKLEKKIKLLEAANRRSMRKK